MEDTSNQQHPLTMRGVAISTSLSVCGIPWSSQAKKLDLILKDFSRRCKKARRDLAMFVIEDVRLSPTFGVVEARCECEYAVVLGRYLAIYFGPSSHGLDYFSQPVGNHEGAQLLQKIKL